MHTCPPLSFLVCYLTPTLSICTNIYMQVFRAYCFRETLNCLSDFCCLRSLLLCSVLVRRIEFLTRELEESKRVQVIKSRECEELLEVAEELARGGVGIIDQSSQSISTTSPGASTPRRNWLQSPDTSLLSPGSSSLFDSPMSGRRRGEIEIPESGTPRGLQTKAGERE